MIVRGRRTAGHGSHVRFCQKRRPLRSMMFGGAGVRRPASEEPLWRRDRALPGATANRHRGPPGELTAYTSGAERQDRESNARPAGDSRRDRRLRPLGAKVRTSRRRQCSRGRGLRRSRGRRHRGHSYVPTGRSNCGSSGARRAAGVRGAGSRRHMPGDDVGDAGCFDSTPRSDRAWPGGTIEQTL